jgi:hypothetical protein
MVMDRQYSTKVTSYAFALLVTAIGAAAAEEDQLHATVDTPAVITATPAAPTAAAGPSPSVVISVNGYQPAQNGGVRAIVKAQKPDGEYQYIGTFGVTGEFKPQSHRIPLPQELAGGNSVKLKVELVPLQQKSSGAGAHLDIGGAEIHTGTRP